ncbi:MAG TPA: hypothetical protein VGH19_12735 [Verrucomicrobiae bacterium]
MSEKVQRGIDARHRLKKRYRKLFTELSALLFRHDPIGISFDDNTDEYELEVGTILPRLATCSSKDDVQRVVYEEMVNWFDAEIAGSFESYQLVAEEIWMIWRREDGVDR